MIFRRVLGIKQDVVDAAPLFLEGFQLFEDWLTKHSLGKDSSKRYAFVTDGLVNNIINNNNITNTTTTS